jgi:hypothetical protein
MKIGNEKVKFSLISEDMIIYRENPKDLQKKSLELTDELSEVSGYKINILKPAPFLCAL